MLDGGTGGEDQKQRMQKENENRLECRAGCFNRENEKRFMLAQINPLHGFCSAIEVHGDVST